jgi:cation-transporting ATPase E
MSEPNELHGLSAAEVAARVARGQVNRAPRSDLAEYRAIAARNVLTLFNALVVPAAVALFLLGRYAAAWSVSALAVANSLIGLVQEVRAKRHLDRLAILTQTRARVLRDGAESFIPAGDVVLDDVLLLAAGDPVVADGTVLGERFLEIDEALLTGESDPVPRRAGDRLLSGSFCVAGEGRYRADKVGGEAFANQTAAQARRYSYTPSPMQRTLDAIIRVLTAITVALCLAYVGLYHLRGLDRADLWEMIAATVTSMVPQGLVLMTTLAFTLGAVRMSARGAVVQQLNAVESMASVDVLCMDKTGTLTTNRLTLDRVYTLGVGPDEARARLRLFAAASLDRRSKSVQALRAALGEPAAKAELIDQVPFKSQNRYSAVRVWLHGAEQALALGAFEALRPLLEEEAARQAEAAWRELLPAGLRVLLLAEVSGNAPFNGALEGFALRPVALVALSDELRPEAGAVLEALAAQGIRFKILSGDNPETVRATVGHLNLPLAREPVVSGDQLAAAADPAAVIREHGVFGRVAPRQKLDVVSTLQAQGHHVGMIGDGVNDVLPIKRADLGIAMGEGSSAARTVAGLVLENNSFDLLPAALDEGRTILGNLHRAAKLFLLKNTYMLLLILMGFGLLGLGFPCLPQQVTLLNSLTIGGPAFLIMLSRNAPPRGLKASFLREVGWFAVSTGLVMGAAGLAVWLAAAGAFGEGLRAQRTLLLSALVLLGLGNVLRIAEGDRWLRRWVAAALPTYALVMYVPPLGEYRGVPLSAAHFFELEPLSPSQWGLVIAVAAPALALCWLAGRLRLRTGGEAASGR